MKKEAIIFRKRTQKAARGVFVNTAKANCSIYESGRMVYNCIRSCEHYTLDYFSLDMFDVPLLATEGKIHPIDGSHTGESARLGGYDFWVFNWHFLTMAPHLALESIGRLPGKKFTVVLELEPDDPLKLIPSDVFDGYIALDPTAPAKGKIFPFPRPLEGDPRKPNFAHEVPVIGSFGFGTPGKGFELLVESVNREFDEAIIRVNIPRGAYTSGCDGIHRQEYSKYLASLCTKLAKPGIDVRFTYDFMSPHELVDWCADNDLNCFMYTRRQSGLSATTDQAIMSGRPLLTGSNDTFRHIHRYIPPYPVIGLRQAIETTVPSVRRMQQDWSRASFSRSFDRMLAAYGLIELNGAGRSGPMARVDGCATVMIASRRVPFADDVLSYATRLADCLGRSGTFHIVRVRCEDLAELEEQAAKLRPDAVIVVDYLGVTRQVLGAALKVVAGPKILLAQNAPHSGWVGDELLIFPRRPIIPYYTSAVQLREGPPRIWLIGFSSEDSNLEMVAAKIERELPEAELLMEVPDDRRIVFEARVAKLYERLDPTKRSPLTIVSLPTTAGEFIARFLGDRLVIFYNDPTRTEELESFSCVAMATERAVAFTRAAPFPHFVKDGTYLEDLAIGDIIDMGMAAQIKLCHEFGESQNYAAIHHLLSEERAVEDTPEAIGGGARSAPRFW